VAAAGQPRVDVADVIAAGPGQAKQAMSGKTFLVRVYSFPTPRIRVRARRRVIEVEEGAIARLVYALVLASGKAAAEGRKPRFREFADAAGDWTAAATYLFELVRAGLATPPGGDGGSLAVAASSMRQKAYEKSVARIADGEFEVLVDRVRGLEGDGLVCVNVDGRVACRYVTRIPRGIAKAQVRALISLAGFKPA